MSALAPCFQSVEYIRFVDSNSLHTMSFYPSKSHWSKYFDSKYNRTCMQEYEAARNSGFNGTFRDYLEVYDYCKATLHCLQEQRQKAVDATRPPFSNTITLRSNDWLLKIHDKLSTSSSSTPTYDSLKHMNRTIMAEIESRRKIHALQLPKLPQDVQTIIDEAHRQPENSILVESFGYFVTVASLKTLKGTCWLNDEIINFYFQLVVHHNNSKPNSSKVHVFNSFFFTKLKEKGYEGVRRWTKQVNLFSHDKILLPVHLGMHWCTALIDLCRKSILYYDSLHGQNNDCLHLLLSYIESEATSKNIPFNVKEWSLVHVSVLICDFINRIVLSNKMDMIVVFFVVFLPIVLLMT